MKNVTRSERIFIIVSYILLGLLAVVTIVPLLSVLITSFVSASEIARRGQFILWPEVWDTSAYGILFKTDKLYTGYANTLFVVIVGTALSMFLTITLAYPLSKRELRGRNGILGMVFFTMLFSGGMVPNYILVKELGLLNSRWALVLPYICNTWNMLIMRNFFYAIPDALEEAAYLDGCNQWQAFTKVMLPLTGNSVAALTIFTAVFAYADLMWPLVVNTDINLMTLSSGLATLKGQFMTNYPVLMAGSLFAMIPMLILYLIFQRQFIEGIALTGGK